MLTDNFLISTNDTGTIELGGFEDLNHNTDESDNPQDLDPIYVLSLDDTVMLQAASDPGVDNITLSLIDALPIWEASHAYTVGQCIQDPDTQDIAGYRYQCVTAGTSGASEPASWPLTVGTNVTTGTAVFKNISPKHELTEFTLAVDDPDDLDTNTPGAALSLGNTILGGVDNKKTVYIRVENNVNIVSNNATYPEVGLQINGLYEDII